MPVRHECCSTWAEQGTPIDMHLIITSNTYGPLATRLSRAARLMFDPDHSSTPRTIHAPVRSRLVRGHYSVHAWSSSKRTVVTHWLMTAPRAERLCAPLSSTRRFERQPA
jgi:hypothetical protein